MARMNPWTDPLPTDEQIREPDRRLDQLLAWLRDQGADGAETAVWILEAVTSEFHLPVVVGDRDPVQHVQKVGAELLWAIHEAGESGKLRPAMVHEAAAVMLELVAQLRDWNEEPAHDRARQGAKTATWPVRSRG